jgi:hypothetical protein
MNALECYVCTRIACLFVHFTIPYDSEDKYIKWINNQCEHIDVIFPVIRNM